MPLEFSNITMIVTVKKLVRSEIHEVMVLVTLKQPKPSKRSKNEKVTFDTVE